MCIHKLCFEQMFFLMKCSFFTAQCEKSPNFAWACFCNVLNEPRREKTGLRGFRPGPTLTGLYSLRSRLEA